MSQHRALTLDRYGSDEWVDLAMLARVDVVVRASRMDVLGAERPLYAEEEGWQNSQVEGGRVLLAECVTWVGMEVTDVLFEDYRRIQGTSPDGRDFGTLPAPPFVVNAVDTNAFFLVSVEAGFDDVVERTGDFVLGLSRGPSVDLVGEPGVSRAFSPVLIASVDADDVFFPDVKFARAASERFAAVRGRLGVDGIVDIVRDFHADDDGVGRRRENFPDLYPPIEEEPVGQEP